MDRAEADPLISSWTRVGCHMKCQSVSWRCLGIGSVVNEPEDASCPELPYFIVLKMLINTTFDNPVKCHLID